TSIEHRKDEMAAKALDLEMLLKDAEDSEKTYHAKANEAVTAGVSKNLSGTNVKPWETAIEPTMPFLPSWKRNIATGLFLSVLLAVLTVIGLDKLDDSVRTPKDLQRKQGIVSMGMIPKSEQVLVDAEAYTLVLHKSFSLVAEALRNLHIGLEVKHGTYRTGQPLAITVTSAMANE